MKRTNKTGGSLLFLTCIVFTLLCSFASCNSHEPKEAEAEFGVQAQNVTDTVEPDNGSDFFTYEDARKMFENVYKSGSHVDYLNYVGSEIDDLKKEIEKLNTEIKELMKETYQTVIAEADPNYSYSDFYTRFIQPYEQYYQSRMGTAESVQEAYLGISEALTYGGNSASDCSLLWEYAHYRNLYSELCDLRDFI